MKSDNKKFMKIAIETAKKGISKGQTPFGACIVKNGKIMSLAHNEVWKRNDITSHAEMLAIKRACKKTGKIDLSNSILYSTCEPCPMCFSACHWARISKIIYGTSITDAKRYGFNELKIPNSKMKLIGRIKIKIEKDLMREECLELFKIWSKQKNKKSY